jgi:hypothetical protein
VRPGDDILQGGRSDREAIGALYDQHFKRNDDYEPRPPIPPSEPLF